VSHQDEPQDGLYWTRGRVCLVGDAAWCVSLLAGQGSATAMAGAYILAGELHRAGGDYKTAFARYEDQFEEFVMRKQRAALKFAGTFAPKSRFSMLVRNGIMNLLRISWLADFVLSRDLGDHLKLPEY
jgi:2-polyprenyl-6-methoxyphenol hydroxylase-like FAD-dependent oxidoreductase